MFHANGRAELYPSRRHGRIERGRDEKHGEHLRRLQIECLKKTVIKGRRSGHSRSDTTHQTPGNDSQHEPTRQSQAKESRGVIPTKTRISKAAERKKEGETRKEQYQHQQPQPQTSEHRVISPTGVTCTPPTASSPTSWSPPLETQVCPQKNAELSN